MSIVRGWWHRAGSKVSGTTVAVGPQPMTVPHDVVPLTAAECYLLLATETVGRVVYTVDALPAIVPVNYAIDGHHLLIRTDPATRLARAAAAGQIVAVEVDQLDHSDHTGWSVVVVGPARTLHDPAELARADALHLVAWAAGERSLLIRVTPGQITGRRLRAEASVAP